MRAAGNARRMLTRGCAPPRARERVNASRVCDFKLIKYGIIDRLANSIELLKHLIGKIGNVMLKQLFG